MRPPTRPSRVNHLGYYTRNARKTVQFWTEIMRCKFTSSMRMAIPVDMPGSPRTLPVVAARRRATRGNERGETLSGGPPPTSPGLGTGGDKQPRASGLFF